MIKLTPPPGRWLGFVSGGRSLVTTSTRLKFARKLHRDGVPVAEIAAQVRKTPEEVQSWLDEDQRRVSSAPSDTFHCMKDAEAA